jgi:hypothetical protein
MISPQYHKTPVESIGFFPGIFGKTPCGDKGYFLDFFEMAECGKCP